MYPFLLYLNALTDTPAPQSKFQSLATVISSEAGFRVCHTLSRTLVQFVPIMCLSFSTSQSIFVLTSSASLQLVHYVFSLPAPSVWLLVKYVTFCLSSSLLCPTHSGLGRAGSVVQSLLSRLSVLLVEGRHQGLQPFDILDGTPQDLHLGQPLVWVHQGAPLQSIEGLVHLLQTPLLPECGRSPTVHGNGLPFAQLTGPGQALTRAVGLGVR